jgi:hypothetical protein
LPCSDFRDGFFYRDVLAKEQADLEELGSLSGQLTLILGIGAVLTFVLVAAGTRSLGKVGPFSSPLYPRVSLGASSPLYSWQPAPAHLARLVLPSLSPASGCPHLCTRGCQNPLTWQGWSSLPSLQPQDVLTFVLVAAGTHSLGNVGPFSSLFYPRVSFGTSSPLYSWLPAPAHIVRWSSLPSPQPRGVITFVLVAAGTRSLGKVGPPFPLPSLGTSSPVYSWLPGPAHLARLILLSLSQASGILTCGCRHPLTWQGWSFLPSPQPRGVLTFVLVAAGTRSLGKVGPPFPLPSLGASSPFYLWLTAPAHLARWSSFPRFFGVLIELNMYVFGAMTTF